MIAQQFADRSTLFKHTDNGAILGRHVIQVIRRFHPTATRHVLINNIRVTRNKFTGVIAKETGIKIIGAIGTHTDDDGDRFAFVKSAIETAEPGVASAPVIAAMLKP